MIQKPSTTISEECKHRALSACPSHAMCEVNRMERESLSILLSEITLMVGAENFQDAKRIIRNMVQYLKDDEVAPNQVPDVYDPNFGDDRPCKCGHPYYRHFDSYENMDPVGCKYCPCGSWEAP